MVYGTLMVLDEPRSIWFSRIWFTNPKLDSKVITIIRKILEAAIQHKHFCDNFNKIIHELMYIIRETY